MIWRSIVCAIIAAGCAHRPPPVDYESTPHLPSPRSGTYARVQAHPADPAIAAAMDGRPWNASLSGAAAGLALDAARDGRCAVEAWRVQEALWRAGYPFPADSASCWTSTSKAPPPPEVSAWLDATPEGSDVGLVRARAASADLWIGLRATPRVTVGVIPRQVQLGYALRLPAMPDATVIAADPDGWLAQASMDEPVTLELDVAGEWMVDLVRGGTLLARFPVYAGMVVPDAPMFTADAADIDGLLDDVRAAYGITAWQRDPLLDAAARAVLRGDDPASALSSVQAGAEAGGWRCEATTTADCLANIAWDPAARRALVADANRAMGLAVGGTDGAVSIAVVVGER